MLGYQFAHDQTRNYSGSSALFVLREVYEARRDQSEHYGWILTDVKESDTLSSWLERKTDNAFGGSLWLTEEQSQAALDLLVVNGELSTGINASHLTEEAILATGGGGGTFFVINGMLKARAQSAAIPGDPRHEMVSELLQRGHATVDEIRAATFGEWPPAGLDIVSQNNQVVQFGDIAERLNDPKAVIPSYGISADASITGDRRIRMPARALNGNVSVDNISTLEHEVRHTSQGDNYDPSRTSELYGRFSSNFIQQEQTTIGNARLNAPVDSVFTGHTNTEFVATLSEKQKELLAYLSDGIETQARLSETLAAGYQHWKTMPTSKEELLVAMKHVGLDVPDELIDSFAHSPTFAQTNATFSKVPDLFLNGARSSIEDINFAQSTLTAEGKMALWDDAMTASYADWLEASGDGPGRARMGLGTNIKPTLRKLANNYPEEKISDYLALEMQRRDLAGLDGSANQRDIILDLAKQLDAGADLDALAAENRIHIDAHKAFGDFFVEVINDLEAEGLPVKDAYRNKDGLRYPAAHASELLALLSETHSPEEIAQIAENLEANKTQIFEAAHKANATGHGASAADIINEAMDAARQEAFHTASTNKTPHMPGKPGSPPRAGGLLGAGVAMGVTGAWTLAMTGDAQAAGVAFSDASPGAATIDVIASGGSRWEVALTAFGEVDGGIISAPYAAYLNWVDPEANIDVDPGLYAFPGMAMSALQAANNAYAQNGIQGHIENNSATYHTVLPKEDMSLTARDKEELAAYLEQVETPPDSQTTNELIAAVSALRESTALEPREQTRPEASHLTSNHTEQRQL